MSACTIRVEGVPAPKGSMRGFARGGRVVLVADNRPRLEEWVQRVTDAAHVASGNGPYPLFRDVALHVEMAFRLPRPKRHYTRQGVMNLNANAPYWCQVKPDLDKLARSTFDALTGPIWCDDARVVSLQATKAYCLEGERPGATITVRAA